MHRWTSEVLVQLAMYTWILPTYRLPLCLFIQSHMLFEKGSRCQLLTECKSKLERESGRGLLAQLNLT